MERGGGGDLNMFYWIKTLSFGSGSKYLVRLVVF